MRFGHKLVLPLSLSLVLAPACGTDGETPTCTTFPDPYDVRSEADRLGARDAIAAAAAERCLTLPAAFDGSGGAAGAGDPVGASGAGASGEAGASGATQ